MSAGQRRITVIGVCLAVAAAVVIAYLARIMLVEREVWLERSFENRWAFRDVPSRRGTIHDRNGIVVATDVACFTLHLDLARFHAAHPCGQAQSGLRELGIEPPGDLEAAGAEWLVVPVGELERHPVARARALACLVALSRKPIAEVRARYRAALRAAPGRACGELLAPEVPSARLLQEYAARAREVLELNRTIVAAGGRDLLPLVLAAGAAPGVHPQLPVLLLREAPFALAARIALVRERCAGLTVLPAVARQTQLPGREGLGSFAFLLGRVGPLQESADAPDPARDLASLLMTGQYERDPFLDLEDLPDEVQDAARGELLSSLRRHFLRHGRVGRTGVERACDEILLGTPGLRWFEQDQRAREQHLLANFDVAPGRDVVLTLDVRLQALAEDLLLRHAKKIYAAPPQPSRPVFEEAALALLDATTGDVLALAGVPVRNGDDLRWTSVALGWERDGDIGSLAKPFVLLEQLDSKRHGRKHRDESTFADCPGRLDRAAAGKRPLTCDERHGARVREPEYAIERSCNFYFYQAGVGLGEAGVRAAYRRVGLVAPLADETALPCDEPLPGFDLHVPPKTGVTGHELEQRSVGYGIEANVLLVARAYAALATGVLPAVGLVRELARPAAMPLGIDAADLEVVQRGLRAAVARGTARKAPNLQRLGVCAKTGTAEVNTRKDNNAWLAGYLPDRGSGRTLAFAAVLYRVPDGLHGGGPAADLADDFFAAIERDPALQQEYLRGSGR